MNALTLAISGISIRQDSEGRFCLNDLHKSSGNNPKHQPAFFARRKQTAELIEELKASANSQTPLATLNDGINNGTYAVKELVYAYAMWISAKFHIAVIRAYDSMVMSNQPETKALPLPNRITEPEALRFRLSMQAHCKRDRVMYKTLYRKVYEHFNITEYAHIPAGRLSEAAKVAGIKLVAAKQTEVAPIQEQVPTALSDENTRLSVNQIAELFERKNILLVSGNEFVAVSKQDYEGIKAYFALAVQLGKKLNLI
jgi:hypothetical protein